MFNLSQIESSIPSSEYSKDITPGITSSALLTCAGFVARTQSAISTITSSASKHLSALKERILPRKNLIRASLVAGLALAAPAGIESASAQSVSDLTFPTEHFTENAARPQVSNSINSLIPSDIKASTPTVSKVENSNYGEQAKFVKSETPTSDTVDYTKMNELKELKTLSPSEKFNNSNPYTGGYLSDTRDVPAPAIDSIGLRNINSGSTNTLDQSLTNNVSAREAKKNELKKSIEKAKVEIIKAANESNSKEESLRTSFNILKDLLIKNEGNQLYIRTEGFSREIKSLIGTIIQSHSLYSKNEEFYLSLLELWASNLHSDRAKDIEAYAIKQMLDL